MLKNPQERLRLSRGVGDGLPNRSDDVAALVAALDHLGRYRVGDEKSVIGRSQLDWKLDNALRGFQRSFGLQPDGRVLPGGPTAATLNTLMAGGLGALVPEPGAHRTRGEFLSRLKLKGSVGEGGENRPEDRQLVRLALGVSGDLELGAALDKAIDDRRLAKGIDKMNRRLGLAGGPLLMPGGRGETMLAGNLKRADRLPETAEGPHGRVIRAAGSELSGDKPRRVQLVQQNEDASNESSPEKSQTGRYVAIDDPALGIWEGGKDFASWSDYIERAENATGVEIPDYKKQPKKGREPELFLNWHRWHRALEDADVGDAQHFAFMLTFAWEGGLTPHLDENDDVIAMAGIPTRRIDLYAKLAKIPTGTTTEDLTNGQRVRFYQAQFDFATGAFRLAGGAEALERIGDKYVAAAVEDTFFTRGTDAIKPIIQDSINATLLTFPELAENFAAKRTGATSSREGISMDGVFGAESLLALQVIVESAGGKQFLLNAIADRRLAFDKSKFGKVLDGDIARYNFYRFQ